MKNCPACGHEYYDEAKWCPDCEIDLPAGAAEPPPDDESVAAALEKLASGQEAGGASGAIAGRLDALYREADDADGLWRRSVDHLRNAREYELAVRLWSRWKDAKPRGG